MQVTGFAIGAVLWIAAATIPSVPRAALAILLVALLLVPYVLDRESRSRSAFVTALALLLASAFALPPSPGAAGLALPWLVATVILATRALLDGIRGLPGILQPQQAPRLLRDATWVLLAVGATFAALDRAGVVIVGLTPTIVLVTAIHFHVLGFGLLTAVSVLAERHFSARASAYPLLAGIAVTATGFTLGLAAIQWVGAALVFLGCVLVASALLREAGLVAGWRRIAIALSAVALLVGVSLGLTWSSSVLFAFQFVSLDVMAAVHGSINTFAAAVAVLALPRVTT